MNETKTWSDSLVYCLNLNSTLASIHDEATDNFLFNLSPGVFQGPTEEYWIGGVRTKPDPTRGEFRWVDQSPFDYTNWASGQPDNFGGIENRVQVFKGKEPDGNTYEEPKWNDRAENTKMFFICQYNV